MYLSRLTLDPAHPHTHAWLGNAHLLHCVVMSGFPRVGGDDGRRQLGVLFRTDIPWVDTPGGRRQVPRVLVQSAVKPEWAIESRAVERIDGPIDLAPVEAAIVQGARFRFLLRANPTRRVHRRAMEGPDFRKLDTSGQWRPPGEVPDEEWTGIYRRPGGRGHDGREKPSAFTGRGKGKRVELTREEDRLAWLARRGREHDGFELLTATLVPGPKADGPARSYFGARADPVRKLTGRSDGHQVTIATALFEGELRVTDRERFVAAWRNGIGPGKAYGCGLLSLARPS